MPLGQLGGQLDRVGQPLADAVLAHQPVDEHLDGVLLVLVELGRLGQLVELAVDVGAHEAFLAQLGELALVLALAVAHHRRQHREARALGQLEDAVDHLLHGLRGDRLAAAAAVDHADARVEQAQVVVDLGDRADRRSRVARRRLLLDRDGGRQPLDRVDVGLAHLVEELARVGRQRLDVAALPFGVDGVERERDLPDPESPVITTSLSRGISTSMFLRLCSRAPLTTIFFMRS